ncbi:ABC transporter permease [Sphingobacterium paludis]|uniref:ABC-type antimicrobial peptide transport system permease subunit n=1 Tax=Sphingobacterium paludis TaxID=1476465 RepID=A0A4R7D5V9_9SPHI|nr:FtsX-like permease family protein [Sphingobacterium paludis]TDS15957.1 ABC-type antimicrobial peptide transport system permease subunit [Sphingobacterium paludis]
MLNLKITVRQLWRNRLFTALNIFGLAIGISACWIVFRVVHYEFSFDQHIPEVDDIRQVVCVDDVPNPSKGFAGIPLGMAPIMTDQALPDALIVPVYNQHFERLFISKADGTEPDVYEEHPIAGTKSSYFKMLPYEWLAGNPETALAAPHSIVLREDRAALYFPNMKPSELVGKTIRADSTEFQITGVVKMLAFPSSFQSSIFIPIPEKEWSNHDWHSFNSNHVLYIKSKNEASVRALLQAAQKQYNQVAAKDHASFDSASKFETFALRTKHFDAAYDTEGIASDKKVMYGLIAIGSFLLLLACINYINLSTAQIPQRAKEIGIRKTLGVRPIHITVSFLMETLCVSAFALLLSFPIVSLFKFIFPEFIPVGIADYDNTVLLALFLIGLLILISIVSSLYPAYLINKLRSIETLKGKVETKIRGTRLTLRKSLIVFQFIIAQFFIVSALVMSQQLDFILHTDLGFKYNAVVNIRMPYKSYQNSEVSPLLYKEALKKHPEIEGISLGHEPLNKMYWGSIYYFTADTGRIQLNSPRKYIDEDYIDLYQIQLLAGKNIHFTDTMREVLINESALKSLGIKHPREAIGKQLVRSDNATYPIVGVFKDFNQSSLHQKVGPLILGSSNISSQLQFFHIKLPTERKQWPKAIAIMEKEWKSLYPNAPFEFKFNEEKIKNIYEKEYRAAKLIDLATGITILISCFGLFGLATLTAFQRTKEIGIRKVLGASISRIVAMLSKDFVVLVITAIVIATPLVWWAMHNWLDNFAYRIEIQWWIFIVAGLLAIGIALMTVGYQAIKAAVVKPVDSLRDE